MRRRDNLIKKNSSDVVENGDGVKHQLRDIDRMIMGIEYEQGATADELAKQFHLSTVWVYQILAQDEVKEVRRKYRDTAVDRVFQAMARNDAQIDDIIDSYIYEARRKSRIQDTDLRSLFTVFNTLIQSKIKLKELTLKEQELDIKNRFATNVETKQNTGLLGDFIKVINGDITEQPQKEQDAQGMQSEEAKHDLFREELMRDNDKFLKQLDDERIAREERRKTLLEEQTQLEKVSVKKKKGKSSSKKGLKEKKKG